VRHATIGIRLSGRRRVVLGVAVAVTLCASTAPAAVADKGGRGYPTKAQVDAAKAEVVAKAQSVASIKAELELANQRLEQAAVVAEQASEAYNGAMWRLQEATDKLAKARKDADRSRRHVAGQRDGIAALVTESYISGGDLQIVDAFVGADGPEGVMDKYLAYEGASTSMDAAYQRFEAASTLADVFEQQAESAKAAQQKAAEDARAARDRAAAAAQSAQQVSDRVTAKKQQLIRQLAKAQGISLKLAQRRQDALARIAAARAAAAAAKKAEDERKKREAAAAAAEDAANDSGSGGSPTPPPAPDPPAPSGGAGTAIAFAKDQLGEPYRWGAAGPDAWDCSGLTMGAWGAAGVPLPHYSAAQYSAGTPISVDDVRPGDLVFWGTSNSPSSIHHVAMYIGNGQIIHAPRTGRPVSIDSMYYWIPPNFFARV